MPSANHPSESPSSSKSALPHYHRPLDHDYSQPTPLFATATLPRSRWELTKQVLFASFMLALTIAFGSMSMFAVFLFDSYGTTPWSWSWKAQVWGICTVIALIDLVLVCTTIRLFAEISAYSVPLVILLVVLWFWLGGF